MTAANISNKDLGPVHLAKTPSWVADAVVYQIFPDRFRHSGRVEAQANLLLKPWGADPAQQGFQGGDLDGVIQGLDHMQAMGINCLYLTPVFSSAANHRYHTYDYFEVDPLLGGNQALSRLIDALHRRGMRLILDAVFNHCGRGFWAFHHLLENADQSPYRDWFHVHGWPLNPYPVGDQQCGYSCWWNDPALPKFNHDNPGVREYLLRVGRYWLEQGIDGWRLDVPDEVPADFWVEFRRMVKHVNADAWIVGEIWGDARSWLAGDQFDGVMNYRLGWSSLSWLSGSSLQSDYSNPAYPLDPLDAEGLVDVWQTTSSWYRPEVNRSQLNLLDSHDVPRALHTLGGDVALLKLALLILFLHQGAPCIFYGTEAGLQGGEEPSCREAFPWFSPWREDLRQLIRNLSDLRKDVSALRQGGLVWHACGADGLHGEVSLSEDDQRALRVWVNRSVEKSLLVPQQKVRGTTQLCIGELSPQGKELGPKSAVVMIV